MVESPTPPGPVEPPDSDPPDGPSEKVKTPKSAKAQRGLVPVRFVVEPTAVNATVICKNRRTTCKRACTISIPVGSSCQFTARGYRDRVVRYRELRVDRGKRLFRVVLSPFKL